DPEIVSGFFGQASQRGAMHGTATSNSTHSVNPTPTSSSSTAISNLAWCNANLTDAALRSLVDQDVSDNVISRHEMLDIFSQVEKDGSVSTGEFSDLKRLVGQTSFF